MKNLTLKEELALYYMKSDVLAEYLNFCQKTNTVPDSMVTSLLVNADSTESLKETKKAIKLRLAQFESQKLK